MISYDRRTTTERSSWLRQAKPKISVGFWFLFLTVAVFVLTLFR